MNEDDLWPWDDQEELDAEVDFFLSNIVFNEINSVLNKPKILPWSRYLWCVMSTRSDETRVMVYGTIELERSPSDVTLRTRVLGTAAKTAREIGVTWDPFNINCLIKPAEGQGAE